MSDKVCATFAEAVQEIPDGASILVGGFGPGTPWNLLAALYHQGATDLTMVTNNAISPAVLQNADGMVTHTTLLEAGRVRRFVASFTAGAHPSQPSPVEALAAAGKLEAELVPQGTLAERIRAGGAGIPAFYTPTGAGTEMARGKEQRDFNGHTYLLEEAITADYAFLRAWKADTFGNLVFRLAQRNYNPIMAMAARCTIVEVEEPIVAEGTIDPDHVHTPGIFVERMIAIPAPPAGILHVPRRGTAPPPTHAPTPS